MAEAPGISLRTRLRDIATLQSQGASIEGAPGPGHVVRPGRMLPPLMFTADEVAALVLGSHCVTERSDMRLGAAAREALARIAVVPPYGLRRALDASALLIGPAASPCADDAERATIRLAIRSPEAPMSDPNFVTLSVRNPGESVRL